MLNSSKDVLNKKDVIKVKFQNPIVNDGLGQSINHLQNLVLTNVTMGFHEHGLETYDRSISVQTMNKQQNNVNGSIVLGPHKWTKINKGMLYKMHSIDFKEDIWTIHNFYQCKHINLAISCVIQMHILFAIVHLFHFLVRQQMIDELWNSIQNTQRNYLIGNPQIQPHI